MSSDSKTLVWVWLDLEMTGLFVDKDVILEVAIILTNQKLHQLSNPFSCAIYQSEEILTNMSSWSQEHHKKSGLLDKVRESTMSIRDVEKKLCNILDYQPPQTTFILCGNSIWQDRLFINKYMPHFAEKLHYRMIDVSSVKEIVKTWYHHRSDSVFFKKNNHRATDDIYESIAELKHYKDHFFINE